MMPILLDWEFDVLITHNRWTLTNRNAGQLIETALSRGVAVMNAAPYAGGVFAKGSEAHPRYVYQEADDRMLDPVRRIERICARTRRAARRGSRCSSRCATRAWPPPSAASPAPSASGRPSPGPSTTSPTRSGPRSAISRPSSADPEATRVYSPD